MIKIISDLDNLGSGLTGNHIYSISEYPALVDSILRAYHHSDDLTAVIHIPIVIQWLTAMAQRYPQGIFSFETMDARMTLEGNWGLSIPDDVRNEDILENGLLDLDIHPLPGQTFDDLLLAHFYSPLFVNRSFPFTQLPHLISSVDKERWITNQSRPLLSRLYSQRLDLWMNTARSSEQRRCIEWFTVDTESLRYKLMAFRVLQAYPAVGETVLGEAYPALTILKLQLHDLPVDEKVIPDVVTQVTYALNEDAPNSAEELFDLIQRVSGLLIVEFHYLEKLLKAHPDWLSFPLVDLFEIKFESLSKQVKKNLAALRAMVHPAKPQPPDPNWSLEQMLSWATTQYLPYQAWCSAQEKFEADLYQIGDVFSEWLINHWEDIQSNSDRMIFNVLPKIAPALNDQRRLHLVLVIDNLGWSFGEILRDLFQERGFFLLNREPYLAMLPTETEISKKCLLSGSVGYTEIPDKTYTKILEEGWTPYLSEKNAFHYVRDIGSLANVETLYSRAYVVNYLAIDNTLHESKNKIGMAHSKHIRHLLTELIENVVNYIDEHNLGDRICIHVVSDHGSTQIPAEIQNDIDLDLVKQSGFEVPSARYVKVSDERFSQLADNLKFDCFFLPAHPFKLPTNMLCARRANHFLSTDKNSFVHGGVLPEEVIVPYMTFEPVSVPLQDLEILMKTNQYRYRLENIEFKIGNPNDAAVEQVQLACLNGNVDWDFQPITLLNGHHAETRQVQARFRKSSLPEETNQLLLRVRYRCRGESHAFDVKLPISMIKMVEEKSTSIFDD